MDEGGVDLLEESGRGVGVAVEQVLREKRPRGQPSLRRLTPHSDFATDYNTDAAAAGRRLGRRSGRPPRVGRRGGGSGGAMFPRWQCGLSQRSRVGGAGLREGGLGHGRVGSRPPHLHAMPQPQMLQRARHLPQRRPRLPRRAKRRLGRHCAQLCRGSSRNHGQLGGDGRQPCRCLELQHKGGLGYQRQLRAREGDSCHCCETGGQQRVLVFPQGQEGPQEGGEGGCVGVAC
eukprot:scaffold26397_cov90-Isochrysis_galbana.AAC.1